MSEQVRRVWISTRAHDRATGEWLTVKGEVVPTDDYAALRAELAEVKGREAACFVVGKLEKTAVIAPPLPVGTKLYTTTPAATSEAQAHTSGAAPGIAGLVKALEGP